MIDARVTRGGVDPGSSKGSGGGASTIGVDGAVCDLGLPCIGLRPAERCCAERCADNCGDRSMSFIATIRLVADCTAASCNAMESCVRLLCVEVGSGL